MNKIILTILTAAIILVGCGGRTNDEILNKEINKLDKSIPLYPKGEMYGAPWGLTVSDDGMSINGVVYVKAPQITVFHWYVDEFNARGWRVDPAHGVNNTIISATKDGRTINMYIYIPDADPMATALEYK